jgi:hypothetical protein
MAIKAASLVSFARTVLERQELYEQRLTEVVSPGWPGAIKNHQTQGATK